MGRLKGREHQRRIDTKLFLSCQGDSPDCGSLIEDQFLQKAGPSRITESRDRTAGGDQRRGQIVAGRELRNRLPDGGDHSRIRLLSLHEIFNVHGDHVHGGGRDEGTITADGAENCGCCLRCSDACDGLEGGQGNPGIRGLHHIDEDLQVSCPGFFLHTQPHRQHALADVRPFRIAGHQDQVVAARHEP